jgi:hypothetical protein
LRQKSFGIGKRKEERERCMVLRAWSMGRRVQLQFSEKEKPRSGESV